MLEAQNEHFVRDFLKFSQFVSFNIDVFQRIFLISPRLPRNLQVVSTCHLTQPCQCDSEKTRNTTHLKCWSLQSAAPATSNASHLLKTTLKYSACHTERLSTRYETCWDVTLSATPAARNDAARSLKHPKVTTFATPARGTAIANSSRTVADGYGRMQAASSEHVPTPDPQSKTRTLRYAVGKNTKSRTPFGTSGCCFEDRRCPNSVLPPSFAGTALEATVFQNPWQFRPPRPVVGCNGLT